MASSWGDLELDDELDDAMVFGHPLIVIAAGAAALLLINIVLCSAIGARGHAGLLTILALASAAAVFAAAWFLDLRRSPTGWSIGAGMAFVFAALLVVAMAMGAVNIADRRDAAMLAAIRINASGEPELPGGERPGPITQIGFDFIRGMLAAARERQANLLALGIDRLTNAAAVEATPQLVTDCDRFARAKPKIAAFDQKFKALADRFRAGLNAKIAQPAMRVAALKGIDDAMGPGFAQVAKVSALLQTQLERAGPLCRLIARRHWQTRGSTFMFTVQADYTEFGRLIEPWNAAVRDIAALQLQARANSGDRIDKDFRL